MPILPLGAENLCLNPTFTGWDIDGGYADICIADEAYIYALPDTIEDEQATPVLCAGIIGYRSLLCAAVPPGGALGIYGFGGSAHLTAQIALRQGYRVHVLTRGRANRQLAHDLCVDSLGREADEPPTELDDAILFAPSGTLVPVARAQLPSLRPDVAVLDARLPDGSGIEVRRAVRAQDPGIRALILTSYDDEDALFASIVAGASGFVLKQISGSRLVEGIRLVASGQSLLDPASTARVLDRTRHGDPARRQFDELTPQEKRVLALIAEGLTNRQISERLNLAEKTIKNYVSVILAKLGLQRRTQAAVLSTRFLDR